MTISNVLKIMATVLVFSACESKPKVIESVSTAPENPHSGSFHSGGGVNVSPVDDGVHKIEVNDVMDAGKYTYLNVTENEEEFWVAVTQRDIEVGETYYFKGGLLKKNFLSKEHNRVFEKLYLVSDLRRQPDGAMTSGSAVDEALNRVQGGSATEGGPIEVEHAEGAVKLSDLFANKADFDGETIAVTGKIVKVNPMIMGRNWLHIQDGSGEDLDLTITTMENIPLGHVVTLEGTIALNKDFGAGYRYDIILEGATLK